MTNWREVVGICDAATDGPWRQKQSFWVECDSCGGESSCHDVASCDEYETAYIQCCGLESFAAPNAAFIATARTALPEAARVMVALEEWKAWCNDPHNTRYTSQALAVIEACLRGEGPR